MPLAPVATPLLQPVGTQCLGPASVAENFRRQNQRLNSPQGAAGPRPLNAGSPVAGWLGQVSALSIVLPAEYVPASGVDPVGQ